MLFSKLLIYKHHMTIQEEIEELKKKLEAIKDEREEGEVLLAIIRKHAYLKSVESKSYIDKLFQLQQKLNDPLIEAWALYYEIDLQLIQDDFTGVIEKSEKAISLFEQLNNQEGAARTYRNIGNIHREQGNFQDALKNLFVALKLMQEIGDKSGFARCLGSIGNVYFQLGNYSEALKNLFEALKIMSDIGEKEGVATCYINIGNLYTSQENYSEALKSYFVALKIMQELGSKAGVAACYSNIGLAYTEQGNYTEALEYTFMSLNLSQEIDDKSCISGLYSHLGNIYKDQNDYDSALKFLSDGLKLSKELGDQSGITGAYSNIGDVYYRIGNYQSALENELLAVELAEKIDHKEFLNNTLLRVAQCYQAIGKFELALKYYERHHNLYIEISGEEARKQLTSLNFQHNMEQKEKDLEITHLRNVELKKERDRSEALLLNILPAEVAEELKEKGKAEAKLFDEVTVLFTDFKCFTTVSEKLTPQQLVGELNECFKAFDEIIDKYSIEKIKTVGDAYIAAAGLPSPNPSHADDMIKAALEIRDFMIQRKKQLGKRTFEMRVGIHSGSVVAGIVGIKKFAYDIWGDTVNTAARMEQHGVPGKINISHTTYELVKNQFRCEYRGEIQAKNKGKLKMYFVV